MGSSIAFAAAFAALSFQPVGTSTPAPLAPSSPWNVEYADNMCILQRFFGERAQPVVLGFKPGPLGEHMRVVLIQPRGLLSKGQGTAKLSFDEKSPVEAGYWSVPMKAKEGQKVQVTVVDLKRADLDPLKTARQVHVHAGKIDVALALDRFGLALKALAACEKDLLASWGMDPGAIDAITTYPELRGGIVNVFSTDDYPMAAIRNNEQGTAGVRFWVSKEGRVRDCKVVESSGSAVLDAQTCAIIGKRARYEPARTKTGDVIESISYQRIRWELPQ
jgi:TonB family protein